MRRSLFASLGLAFLALFAVCGEANDLAVLTEAEAGAFLAGQDEIDPVPADKTLDCIKDYDNCLDCLAQVRCTVDAKTDKCRPTEPETTCTVLATFVDCGVVIRYPKPNCAGLPTTTAQPCIDSNCQ